jgi:cation diffusion facilitator family transporter
MSQERLGSLLLLSIGAALVTLGLKAAAYWVTGSVGLLSEAVESLVNLVAAGTAYLCLRYASRPVDASHTYGHEKIEFFSSGTEGVLILATALGMAYYAARRMFVPEKLETLGLGMTLSLLAALLNGAVGLLLLRAGRHHHSIILEADGKHLLTDVWTSAGVLAALAVVALTDYQILDPLIALVVAANILRTGVDLMRRSFNGLMDHSLPEAEQVLVRAAIEANLSPDMDYHALRTRQAGSRRFVDFHLLVPGTWAVKEAHTVTVRIEEAIEAALPGVEVTVHVEPIEDRRAWEDSALLPVEEAAGHGPRHPRPPESDDKVTR